MNNDEREERIAIVAEGCKVSQEEAETKVQEMANETMNRFAHAMAIQGAKVIHNAFTDAVKLSSVPPRNHRQDI